MGMDEMVAEAGIDLSRFYAAAVNSEDGHDVTDDDPAIAAAMSWRTARLDRRRHDL
jgi:hypothetical protein